MQVKVHFQYLGHGLGQGKVWGGHVFCWRVVDLMQVQFSLSCEAAVRQIACKYCRQLVKLLRLCNKYWDRRQECGVQYTNTWSTEKYLYPSLYRITTEWSHFNFLFLTQLDQNDHDMTLKNGILSIFNFCQATGPGPGMGMWISPGPGDDSIMPNLKSKRLLITL